MQTTLRPYAPADAVPIWQVYYAAIRGTAIRDYTEEQTRSGVIIPNYDMHYDLC